MSHYNKITKPKSRGSPSNVPKGICRYCKEKISPENRIFQGTGGYKRECRPCRRKVNYENNRRKRQIIKDNPLW